MGLAQREPILLGRAWGSPWLHSCVRAALGYRPWSLTRVTLLSLAAVAGAAIPFLPPWAVFSSAFAIVVCWLGLQHPLRLLFLFTLTAVNLGSVQLGGAAGDATNLDVVVTSLVSPLLLLGSLNCRFRHVLPKGAPLYALAAYVIFLFTSLVTLPFSPAGLVSVKAWFRFVSYLVIFISVFCLSQTRRSFAYLLLAVMSSSLLPISVAAYQYAFQSGEVVVLPGFETVTRLRGTTGGSFTFAFYLLMIVVMATALLELADIRGWTRASLCALLILAGTTLVFTYIRGAWLGLIAALLVLGAARMRRILLIVPVAAAALILLVEPIQRRLLTVMTPEDTSTERLLLWRFALELAKEQPILGHGLYAFEWGLIDRISTVLPHSTLSTSPHNEYLQFLVDSGVVGTMAFYVAVLTALWTGWCVYKRASEPLFRATGLGFMLFTVGLLTGGLTQNPLSSQPAVGIYFWILFGLTAAAMHTITTTTHEGHRLSELPTSSALRLGTEE